MNYFALFLNIEGFVEQRLSLIRYISNPGSSSLPHITVRLFKDSDAKLEYVKSVKFSELNIIEPGNFNFDKRKPPYIVYIRCESAKLEELEYKPAYPFSKLHITLYDGGDISYAEKLFCLLNKENWNFELSFNGPIYLTERKLGSKVSKKDYFKVLYQKVIGDTFNDFLDNINNNDYRLALIENILKEIDIYKKSNPEEIKKLPPIKHNETENIKAVTAEKVRFKVNQLSFDLLDSPITPQVDQQVEDAIYVTPPEYARDMAICALEAFKNGSSEIDFGDSAIGTGALFLALWNLVDNSGNAPLSGFKIRSAIGIDISEKMATEAFIRHEKRGLEVIYGDAILPDIELNPDRNLMIVNPPFNRHGKIPKDYREKIHRLAENQTGISIKGDAGLHVYHLLIMDKWLKKGGVASWLLPSIFLQSRYGEAIRLYLLNNVQFTRLHLYDENMPQFSGTDISTVIITFKKCPPSEHEKLTISYGESVTDPDKLYQIDKKELHDAINNWRRIMPRFGENNCSSISNTEKLKFDDLFEIKRGLATGANSFFVMNHDEAKKRGIPDSALKPLLPKARYLNSLIVNTKKDGYPDIDSNLVLIDSDMDEDIIQKKYPLFYEYLQSAKQKGHDGKAIIDRTLVKSRKPWYSQEKRNAPSFLLTYMGRNKKNLPPLYFILNKSNAVALNTYLLLYPKFWLEKLLEIDESLYVKILYALNKSAEHVISQQTRIYSGGLQKLEPGELRSLPIIELPQKVIAAFNATGNLLR